MCLHESQHPFFLFSFLGAGRSCFLDFAFLRVPCSSVQKKVNSSPVQPGTPWQYGILKSATSPPSEARRGNYEPQQYAGTSSIPLNSTSQLPSTSAPSPASQVDFDYGTTPPSSAFDRSSYGSASSLGYDDSPMAYTMQAPSYLLPSSDTSAVSGFCGIPSNLRGWPSSTQPFKPTNAQLYCDIDSQSPLAPSPNYSFSSHASSQGPALTESTSAFPVGATLPPGLTGAADRTLPDPAGGRNNSHMQHASGADNLANNNASSSLSDHCRKPHSLSADVFLPGNDRYVASNVITTSEAMKAAAASTPQDMGFGYIPISNSSPVPTVDVTNGFQSSHSEMERSKREDLLYPPNICSASAYVYSTGTKSGTPYDSEPTATLTSGHEYTQLIDPHSRPVVMGSTAEDLRPINTNGNPISSYGGRSGF